MLVLSSFVLVALSTSLNFIQYIKSVLNLKHFKSIMWGLEARIESKDQHMAALYHHNTQQAYTVVLFKR